jgi:hypothetical protein
MPYQPEDRSAYGCARVSGDVTKSRPWSADRPRSTSGPAHGANVARSRRLWRRAWAVWLGDAAEFIVDLVVD